MDGDIKEKIDITDSSYVVFPALLDLEELICIRCSVLEKINMSINLRKLVCNQCPFGSVAIRRSFLIPGPTMRYSHSNR